MEGCMISRTRVNVVRTREFSFFSGLPGIRQFWNDQLKVHFGVLKHSLCRFSTRAQNVKACNWSFVPTCCCAVLCMQPLLENKRSTHTRKRPNGREEAGFVFQWIWTWHKCVTTCCGSCVMQRDPVARKVRAVGQQFKDESEASLWDLAFWSETRKQTLQLNPFCKQFVCIKWWRNISLMTVFVQHFLGLPHIFHHAGFWLKIPKNLFHRSKVVKHSTHENVMLMHGLIVIKQYIQETANTFHTHFARMAQSFALCSQRLKEQ